MYSSDHRTPTPRLLGGLAIAASAGYALPALAAAWAPLRAPLGIEDRTASGDGYALTFDDGPHPRGTPAMLQALAQEWINSSYGAAYDYQLNTLWHDLGGSGILIGSAEVYKAYFSSHESAEWSGGSELKFGPKHRV